MYQDRKIWIGTSGDEKVYIYPQMANRHGMIAGATGTGKSVCLNTMLISLLYRYSPEDLRLIIVDPKMVEFEMYKGLPHLMFNDIIELE